jgi:membrane-anchored protein YejM (alkaline phosphatase superfamily)
MIERVIRAVVSFIADCAYPHCINVATTRRGNILYVKLLIGFIKFLFFVLRKIFFLNYQARVILFPNCCRILQVKGD